MNAEFWKGKRVFITGHTGFKGSWLSLWLQSAGARVTGYALAPPTTPSLFDLAGVKDGMTSIEADIRDGGNLKRILVEHDPDIVIHMAAQTVVLTSYEDPVLTYDTNVLGTVNLLEAVRASKNVRAVVNVTTDKCYENKEWLWGYRESDVLGGYDPYSNSKACSELVTRSYRDSFFRMEGEHRYRVGIATARAGNVLGGGDWTKDQLVPDIMRAILARQPVRLRSPRSIRPWQFVMDSLDGYLTLAERLCQDQTRYAESWNFGPSYDDAHTVEWIVRLIARQWGEEVPVEVESANLHHEAGYLKLDSSKARSLLAWAPRLSLEQTIGWVVEWYRAFGRKEDVALLTRSQIARYQALPRQNEASR